jgi:hypothetical protein
MTTTIDHSVAARQDFGAMTAMTPPDPEVPERSSGRRQFSAKYKARILAEYEAVDRSARGACQRTAGIPRGRTAFLQVGGQQFSKWADSSSPSGRPRRRPLQLVLLGTGARSQIAGATTGCLSGDVLGHSCPPASPSSLSARR